MCTAGLNSDLLPCVAVLVLRDGDLAIVCLDAEWLLRRLSPDGLLTERAVNWVLIRFLQGS